jgi:cytochrome oxidase Cu insertion factor (SCO1/SenC/PrrC family)
MSSASVPVPKNSQLLAVLAGFLALVVVATLGVGTAIVLRAFTTSPPGASPQVRIDPDSAPAQLPEFTLVNASGESVTDKDLRGQVLIFDFFFTRCSSVCPMISSRMNQIQSSIPPDADVKLLSITVDPEHDTPAVLAEYAKNYGAKDGRWLFLTGDKDQIVRIIRDGFKLSASPDPDEHSPRLSLVDRDGRVVGQFDARDPAQVTALQAEIRKLVRQDQVDG